MDNIIRKVAKLFNTNSSSLSSIPQNNGTSGETRNRSIKNDQKFENAGRAQSTNNNKNQTENKGDKSKSMFGCSSKQHSKWFHKKGFFMKFKNSKQITHNDA